jgi:hypothetical protein
MERSEEFNHNTLKRPQECRRSMAEKITEINRRLFQQEQNGTVQIDGDTHPVSHPVSLYYKILMTWDVDYITITPQFSSSYTVTFTIMRIEQIQDIITPDRSQFEDFRESAVVVAQCCITIAFDGKYDDFLEVESVRTNVMPVFGAMQTKRPASKNQKFFEGKGFATLLIHLAFYLAALAEQGVEITAATPKTKQIIRRHYTEFEEKTDALEAFLARHTGQPKPEPSTFYLTPQYSQKYSDFDLMRNYVTENIEAWFEKSEDDFQIAWGHLNMHFPV